MNATVIHADCLDWMREQPDDSVSLVLGSPPYEAARTYGIEFKLRGQDWVDWMVERMREMVRISSGLVCMVLEGQTRQFRWSATPALLMADLHRAGIHLRKPPIFHRVGIPGSGGPDWLRNDYEFCVCCTSGGKLPWSDNTAMGHPPKWAPGGAMSHRLTDGARMNQWGKAVRKDGELTGGHSETEPGKPAAVQLRPSHKITAFRRTPSQTQRTNGDDGNGSYEPPTLANPGNVIHVTVGGGLMGSELAHENEAPYPEKLAEFFVRSFCPHDGIVFDPFSGSGTTGAVALKTGRRYVGTDIRASQVELTKRRLAEVQVELF